MRLVNDQQVIAGQEVNHRPRMRARFAAIQVTRVVFDARAIPHFLEHFQIVARALFDALRLQQFALLFEHRQPFFQLAFNVDDGFLHTISVGEILLGGIDRDFLRLIEDLTRQRTELQDALDLVPEERDAEAALVFVRGDDLQRVPPDSERAAPQVNVVTLILTLHQLSDERVAPIDLPHLESHRPFAELLGRAEAVNARHRRDDDHILARDETGRRGQPQALDLLVDLGLFLDIEIVTRNICFGLKIIIVGDKIFDRVLREEILELGVELRGERFVVRHDERGHLQLLDDTRY